MNTHQEIARITEELRALYLNDNDAPRLIAEMLEREFPKSLTLASRVYDDLIEELEEELEKKAEILEKLAEDLRGEQ
jgi:hypothetical protein